jgi:protein gp37
MGEVTAIAWTNHTWNPWRGCTKVSAGCKNCYMFTQQRQYGNDPSIVLRTKTWGKPYIWNQLAEQEQTYEFVFTCSWSDWFHETADPWRDEAWEVIRNTPNLIYQILTKRPERIKEHLPTGWKNGWHNVWLGVSVENNQYVGRADLLREIPARVRFISYEPALGPLDQLNLKGIHWVIYGGESGPGFRPHDVQWARDMRARCEEQGIAFFYKQSAAPRTEMGIRLDGQIVRQYPESRM